MSELLNPTDIYQERFSAVEREHKKRLWRILCKEFFQKYVQRGYVVLDLGAGYCEFINNINCSRRIALDINPEVRKFADPDVEILLAQSTDLGALDDASVDIVFASNFFEHLKTKEAFVRTLHEAYRVLKCGGRILILQPNIRVIGGRYWDFLDHQIPLSDRTIVEALRLVGFSIHEVKPRFLPYTTKSRIPQWPILVWLYLRMPSVQQLLGEQAWVVGEKHQ